MRPFRDVSIRRQLFLVSVVASSTALLLASLAFLAYDQYAFRAAMVRRATTDAEIIGLNSASALLFDDERAAGDTLSAMRAKPQAAAVRLYDSAGKPFATFTRNGGAADSLPALAAGESTRFEDDRLRVFRPVLFQGAQVGTVLIEWDLSELRERARSLAAIILAVSLFSFAAALASSARYHGAVSGPLLQLAETAREVSRKEDYSLRAAAEAGGEARVLIETFNQMLSRIETRDAELQEARATLEQRVEERTRDLQRELAERRRAEQEIRRLNGELAGRLQELTALNQEIESFSYSVSHDLRAPLRHINGFVDLLRDRAAGGLDPTSRRYLGVIADSAKKMGRLIDDLLAFSRMNRTEMLETRVSLDELLKDVLQEIRMDTATRDIAWQVGCLPAVQGDRAMLRVALMNLLANAVKYTSTRSQARIEVGELSSRDGDAVLYVKDNGVGFDMQYAPKLFGVFQRLHRAEDFEGTGIGLATVRRVIHRHGGHVWAEGVVDGGATFYVSLPRRIGDQA